MSYKAYNGAKRLRCYPNSGIVVEVDESKYDWSKLTEDDPETWNGFPAYALPSVVDKSCYNPAANTLTQVISGAARRRPVYDTENGEMPDVGINLGWLRHPSRDRTEIDMAYQIIKNTVESAKSADKQELENMLADQKAKETLKDTLTEALNSPSESTEQK